MIQLLFFSLMETKKNMYGVSLDIYYLLILFIIYLSLLSRQHSWYIQEYPTTTCQKNRVGMVRKHIYKNNNSNNDNNNANTKLKWLTKIITFILTTQHSSRQIFSCGGRNG